MQRLRSSPQGSVLGALNALFSPHPVIGGPSPQQAAAKGLLGQMFSAQGGGSAVVPGAQGNGPTALDVLAGRGGTQPAAAAGSQSAAEGALAGAAADEKSAAAATKVAATDQVAAAAGLQGAASDLRDAAFNLTGLQSVSAAIQKVLEQRAAATAAAAATGAVPAASVAASRGGGGSGGAAAGAAAAAGATAAASQGGGGGGQSAAASLIALAGAAASAGDAYKYAYAAQKAFTGSETDVAAAAKAAATALSGQVAATTSASDAYRYTSALQVAQSLAAKSTAGTGQAAATAKPKITALSDAIAAGVPVWTAGTGAFGAWNGHLQLFGGALTGILPPILATVSGLHLVTEAVIETAGTLIPATIAFGAFGIAAVPTVKALYGQMKDLYTVTQAFGVQIYPLTGAFSKVAAAVQPQVYELFGEALVIAGQNTGAFQTLATGAGKVLDQLGARFANAITQGNGFSTFTRNAAQDLSIWGNNIGNLGGIIGGFLKVVPGYAQVIGNVFGTVTHDIEVLVNSGIGQWILSVGLAAHGALIYIGLLATGFAKLAQVGLTGIAAGLLSAAGGVAKLGAGGAAAASGMTALATGAKSAAALPWGWISLAAAGVAYLAYELLKGSDAVGQYVQSVQTAIGKTAVSQLGITLVEQQVAAMASLSGAQKDAAGTAAEAQKAIQGLANTGTQDSQSLTNSYVSQYRAQNALNQQIADNKALLPTLSQDYQNYSILLQAAAGNTGLLTAAGITSNDVLNAGQNSAGNYTSQMKQLIIEVMAAADTQKALKIGSGQLGAAMNAQTNQFITSTVPALQQLATAEDAVTTTLLGGEQSITAFQQALTQMGTDARTAGAHLGDLHGDSLALTSDFYSSVLPAMQKVGDSMLTMGASQSQMTTVIATMAAEQMKWVDTNSTARAVMVAMINNALGPGTVSMKNLDKWVQQNGTSLTGMATVMGQVTANASQMSGVLQQSLNPMLAQAAANAYGGQKSLDKFAAGVINGDTTAQLFASDGGQQVLKMFQQMYQHDAPAAEKAFVDWAKNGLGLGQQAAQSLWNQLTDLQKTTQVLASRDVAAAEKAFIGWAENGLGLSLSSAQGLWKQLQTLQTFIDQMHGTSLVVAMTASAKGVITYSSTGQGTPGFPIVKGSLTFGAASGGRVPGSGSGDTVPAMLTPGEVVVPVPMVQAGAVDHLRGQLPGFAAGGLVGLASALASHNPDPWAAAAEKSWAGAVETTYAKDVNTAWQNQVTNWAKSQGVGPFSGLGTLPLGPGGPLSSSAAVAQAFASSILWAYGWGQNQMPPLIALWNQESGWNSYAVNPGSGAYGIPQALPAAWGHPYALGDYQAQVRWGLGYISGRYGSPGAAEAHELAMGWYGNGGWVNEPVIGIGMRSGRGYGFAEHGPEYVSRNGPGGGTATARLADTINLMLPEGTTLAQAFTELSWQLRVAQMQQSWGPHG